MEELEKVEQEVLGLLLFPESFATIVSECESASSEHVVADAIKNLIHKKLIVSGFMNKNGEFKASFFYDSDAMKRSAFKATSKGLSLIK